MFCFEMHSYNTWPDLTAVPSLPTDWSGLTAAASSFCDDAIHPPEIYRNDIIGSKLPEEDSIYFGAWFYAN